MREISVSQVDTDILRCLRDAIRREHPEKYRTNSWFLLHDYAPAHRSGLLNDFLAMNTVTTPVHPPYYPDLPTADFFLSPEINIKETADF